MHDAFHSFLFGIQRCGYLGMDQRICHLERLDLAVSAFLGLWCLTWAAQAILRMGFLPPYRFRRRFRREYIPGFKKLQGGFIKVFLEGNLEGRVDGDSGRI